MKVSAPRQHTFTLEIRALDPTGHFLDQCALIVLAIFNTDPVSAFSIFNLYISVVIEFSEQFVEEVVDRTQSVLSDNGNSEIQ